MKTIIIGYSDQHGFGEMKIVSGPEVSTLEQSAILDQADSRHIFPEGIKRLEMFGLDQPLRLASFISDDVAKFKESGFQKTVASQKAQQEKNQKERESQNLIAISNKAVTLMARRRDHAIGAVAAQRTILATPGLPEKDKPALLAKVESLQKSADAAITEFKAMLDAREVVKNQKSKPEAIAKAKELIQSKLK